MNDFKFDDWYLVSNNCELEFFNRTEQALTNELLDVSNVVFEVIFEPIEILYALWLLSFFLFSILCKSLPNELFVCSSWISSDVTSSDFISNRASQCVRRDCSSSISLVFTFCSLSTSSYHKSCATCLAISKSSPLAIILPEIVSQIICWLIIHNRRKFQLRVRIRTGV